VVKEWRMSEGRVRWGVISTANIGRTAVNPAIQASSNGELVAVASRDPERARSFAEAHAIPRHYGSYQALLDDSDIDAVYNPLPNSLHLEWTVRAAEAGKHVLCEKPLAVDERECREMAAAEANDVKLLEAFMYRFHPRTDRVVEMVRRGVIGELRTIRSAFTFRLTRPDNIRLDPELGGGSLMDVGCYCVNVSRTLTGTEPVKVQATAQWAASGVDEQLVGTLLFPDGVTAHFDCALTMERCESYEVAGTDGYLTVPASFLPGTGDSQILEHRSRGEVVQHTVAGADQYQRMVEHFGGAVLRGRPLRYSADEAAQNMRAIEGLYRSARGRGEVVAIRD
jgi:predicted dehydrogenase